MDKRREKLLLKALLAASDDDKYVIVKVGTLLERLRLDDTDENRAAVVGAVRGFINSEYVGCKFFDTQSICVLALAKGRQWEESEHTARAERRNRLLIMLGVFVCALVGSFLGALFADIIFR